MTQQTPLRQLTPLLHGNPAAPGAHVPPLHWLEQQSEFWKQVMKLQPPAPLPTHTPPLHELPQQSEPVRQAVPTRGRQVTQLKLQSPEQH
jgi:hypothetical protein